MLTRCLPKGTREVIEVAVLSNQVYIFRFIANEIEVVDFTGNTSERRLVNGLVEPSDLISYNRFWRLYITDCDQNLVYRVKIDGGTTRWEVNDVPDKLSGTSDGNVLVMCGIARKLKEFTTKDFKVRTIILQEDLVHPRHAVMSRNKLFISFGDGNKCGVCVVDFFGQVKKTYNTPTGIDESQTNNYLYSPAFVVDKETNIIILDYNISRLLLLNETLSDVRELLLDEIVDISELHPCGLCLDETRGRLL